MAATNQSKIIRLLVLNPNCSEDMTHGMRQAIRSMDLPDHLEITYYTAPLFSGGSDIPSPASINNQADLDASAAAVYRDFYFTREFVLQHDGVLVACYSSHPLVSRLAAVYPQLAVTGIFEASISAVLPLLYPQPPTSGRWGIVTTGTFWEDHLEAAVQLFLDQQQPRNNTFRGVFTTGFNAADFHDGGVAPENVTEKLKDATMWLLASGGVDCVVMGCAGMAGLEGIIRETIVAEYGEERARKVYVVDSVRAGVSVLEGMVRNRRMFLPHS